MVGWVAGEEGSKKERLARDKWEKTAADIFNICLEYFKAACLFEIAQSPATMDGGMGTSLGHICIQKTSC